MLNLWFLDEPKINSHRMELMPALAGDLPDLPRSISTTVKEPVKIEESDDKAG